MSFSLKVTGLLLAAVVSLPIAVRADADTPTTHRVHTKKKPLPPPLPSGTQGPVPQVPLDAIPAVAPQVTYEDGLLTIVAPNSTLGDILRGVRKHTSAEIEIPATASERVVTRLGPAPAREVMAELLNGSRFNYILLGSPADANALVRVVLVAKTPDTPAGQPAQAENGAAPAPVAKTEAPEPDPEEPTDDTADQNAAEAEQPAPPPEQPGVKTPQQLLQEMQQRQMLMQQQQQSGQPGPGIYPPPPGLPGPQRPQPQQPQQQEQ
ncbi:MAG TPA: hypothetical protein VGZ91_02135 [Candidatus Sulfotelmatobacter sp.]|jgi:hypothetical protein|nr:hypothetical protein [Candidatus Sulfotelmatobacter sp.]